MGHDGTQNIAYMYIFDDIQVEQYNITYSVFVFGYI